MTDERSSHGRLRPDAAAKDDWVLKGFEQFPADAVNVSSHDLRYFSSLLQKSEFVRRARAEPLLGRLVSANTTSESSDLLPPRPFIISDVPGRQPGAKPIRVAFIGLTETIPTPPPGFKFIDPAEAAKHTVAEVRSKTDLVIVLAKVSSEEATRIAREASGIDVIIAGNGVSLQETFTPPFFVGHTLVVFTPFETRMLGEVRFYLNAEGKFTTRQRFIALDETSILEDPAAKRVKDAAAMAESQARLNSKKFLDDWPSKSPARTPGPGSAKGGLLAGSTACSQCHLAQYMKWANSAHAHAGDKLAARSYEFEASCLNCHATGVKTEVSTGDTEVGGLQEVQCEQCHGPGADHVGKHAKGYGRVANMQAACASCHTSETSPGFDVNAAWAKIKH